MNVRQICTIVQMKRIENVTTLMEVLIVSVLMGMRKIAVRDVWVRMEIHFDITH